MRSSAPESRIVVVANPVSGGTSRKKIEAALGLLKERGLEVELFLTAKRGDAERFSREAALGGPRMVVAAGGDGTFNEVANGLAGTGVPMALLPLGTTNVMAKELGVPENVKGAVETALRGEVHSASLGKVTLQGDRARYFCSMAGFGFDGQVVQQVGGKKHRGKVSHVLTAIRVLLSWAPEELDVTAGGKTYKGYILIACKAGKYAGNFSVAPDADITEPFLHAVLMHGRRRLDVIRYALGIMTGRHLGFRDVTYFKAESLKVAGRAHIQVDGDYIGHAPASVTVEPGALRLLY
jgi:YegS/Rv2252/BmrU family lipid kinase